MPFSLKSIPPVRSYIPTLFYTVGQIFFIFILLFTSYLPVKSQVHNNVTDSTADSISIDHIFIIGNRVTKEKIIRRELDFREGQTFQSGIFNAMIKRNEQKIINTSLFVSVNISKIDLPDHKADIIIRVVERWYLFPIPVLELADRNFDDWWINHDHDFHRIEWGLRLIKYNMRGMNETLKLTGQFGYTKRVFVSYNFPYINHKQKTGLSIFFDYALNKNTSYKTVNNKLYFLNSDRWLKEYYTGGLAFTLRKSFYAYHTFGASFIYNKVNDTIPELNPGYFNNGKNNQRYFRLYYSFLYDHRDITAYPLHGSYFMFDLNKYGIGLSKEVNFFEMSALYYRFLELPLKFYLSAGFGARISFPGEQPYNMFNSLGYGQFTLRGYELYVIEGQHIFQSKFTLRKCLYKFETEYHDYFSPRQIQHFHLAIYLKTFGDFGYVSSYGNYAMNDLLANQLLYGYGVGADLFTVYDMLLSWDYSFNKLGEHGFVFGVKKSF